MRAVMALFTVAALASVPARALDAPGSDGALHASYETRIRTPAGRILSRRWTFTRGTNWVEYRWHDRNVSEQWRTDVRHNISYSQVFHGEKTVVRYTAGDLDALGIDAGWRKLNHVIVPPLENRMAPLTATRSFDQPAQRYRGQRDSTRTSVTWLPELQLPADVQSVTEGGQRVHVRLLELKRLPSSEVTTDLGSYRQLDFTDFGDMAYDPFVRKHFGHAHRHGVEHSH